MLRVFIAFLLLCLFTVRVSPALAQSLIYESGGVLTPELAATNVHYYDLDIKVNPADSTVLGSVEVHFHVVNPSNRIELALDPRLAITGIERIKHTETTHLRYIRSDTTRTFYVYFNQTLQPGSSEILRIHYEGKPRVAPRAPWDGGMVWAKTPSGDPWVGVAVQGNGAWLWWPNKDHPSDRPDSVAINITMPDDLVVASNGRLRGETVPEEGWKTWHWFVSTPISNYNVTLNAAPYEIISEPYESITGEEFDITFWVLPEYLEKGKKLFPQFAEQMRFMEMVAGPYPFRADKYGVVHSPYLGMEHQSIIAYGANFENNNLFGIEAGFDDLHQHELAHEWWGNLVTAWDWRDFWLHEGFGTYMQPLYAEHIAGKEVYREMMSYIRTRIIDETDREVAPRESMSSLEITRGTRGGNVYFKGAWFLHTLRYLVGDDLFFTTLRRFAYPDPAMEEVTDGSHMRYATTDDFLYTVEAVTGMELGWLFDVYLRQPVIPELYATRRTGYVRLQWIVPEGYRFPMPLEVAIDGEVVTLVPERSGVISFEVPDHIEVEVDPNNWILKNVRLGFEGE
ncbi:MAG: M1 family peptidase [Balneolaceae bacterium]|nr:MAG: M1 family peptidase [Balneolaceae bacterium]